MIRRRIVKTAAVAALILTGSMATAPGSAQAEVTAQDACTRGEACIYLNSGALLYSNGGNTGNISVGVGSGGYVVNRGVAYRGLDHIQVRAVQSGYRYTVCLHYGAGTNIYQPEPNAAGLGSGYITGWTWRGECTGSEDEWQYVGPA
jgi:hypothetical protein